MVPLRRWSLSGLSDLQRLLPHSWSGDVLGSTRPFQMPRPRLLQIQDWNNQKHFYPGLHLRLPGTPLLHALQVLFHSVHCVHHFHVRLRHAYPFPHRNAFLPCALGRRKALSFLRIHHASYVRRASLARCSFKAPVCAAFVPLLRLLDGLELATS